MDEFIEKLEKQFEPQKKMVRELMAELNGKHMDYESCRMLEDFFNDYTNMWINTIKTKIEQLGKKYKLVPKKTINKNKSKERKHG